MRGHIWSCGSVWSGIFTRVMLNFRTMAFKLGRHMSDRSNFCVPAARTCTRTGRLLNLLPLSPLSTYLFSFGPQSARAGGEVTHVDPIDRSSSVRSEERRVGKE